MSDTEQDEIIAAFANLNLLVIRHWERDDAPLLARLRLFVAKMYVYLNVNLQSVCPHQDVCVHYNEVDGPNRGAVMLLGDEVPYREENT